MHLNDRFEELKNRLKAEGRLKLWYADDTEIKYRTLIWVDDADVKVEYPHGNCNVYNIYFIEDLITWGEAEPNYWLAYRAALRERKKSA